MKLNKIEAQFKRELWENRAGFLWAPLVSACFLFVAALWFISAKYVIHGEGITSLDSESFSGMEFFVSFYQGVSWGLLSIVFSVVIVVYTHSTLFSDRKTREIIFWRSLPVSETTNVLIKLTMVCIVVPLIIFVANLVGGFLFIAYLAIVNPDFGKIISALLSLNISFRLLGTSFLVVLLILPFVAWVLFCSAYARRSPVTISLTIPLVLAIADATTKKYFGFTLLFNESIKSYIQPAYDLVKRRFDNAGEPQVYMSFISSFDLQVTILALLFSALMIGAAIWLRNNRYEI